MGLILPPRLLEEAVIERFQGGGGGGEDCEALHLFSSHLEADD